MRGVLLIMALWAALTACHRPLPDGTATDTASVEALARAAADSLSRCDRGDTLAMQGCLVDAHARKSRFVMAGNSKAAETFDRAFEQRLREVDPQLHDVIFLQR